MDNRDKKILEKFDNDFHQIASQEGWEREDIVTMKDLQKLMYYMELRCAMKENEEYRDEMYDMGNMGDMDYNRSYNNNRYYDGGNMYGRGNSYARNGYGRSSGRRSYNSYAGGGSSGRRYYDGEKENSINDIRQMVQMEQDPEKRSILENVMRVLENDK